MKIALLTTGRFWLVDLARELRDLGHEAIVYSLVPPWKMKRYGLVPEAHRWLGPYVAPLYGALRVAKHPVAKRLADRALREALDFWASRLIEPCDAFIGMAGMSLRTIETLHRRGVRRTFLERASRHILSQRDILADIAKRKGVEGEVGIADDVVYRELAEYELTDMVTVPARHVEESFLERGYPQRKLFRNPFGVSLEQFPPTSAPSPSPPTIIMAGAFGLRKGADVLLEAVSGMPGVKLLHVGSSTDMTPPTVPWFEEIGHVPQSELTRHYARAHVAALASREEGLALVQLQKLASGLPLVCTDRTGGADLRPYLKDPSNIFEVPHDDAMALRQALLAALERGTAARGLRDQLSSEMRSELTWKAYARRYEEQLMS